jgi:hypothetical protein
MVSMARQLTLEDAKRGLKYACIALIFAYFSASLYFVAMVGMEFFDTQTVTEEMRVSKLMDKCTKISSHPYPIFRCFNETDMCKFYSMNRSFGCDMHV